MTTAFWTAEYAAKARDADPLQQSGRGKHFTALALLHQLRAVCQQLDLQPHHTLLDLGCGNALFTVPLSGLCQSVLAVEPVCELRAHAAENCAVLPNVTVTAGDALSIPAPDAHFDRVLMHGVLQLIPADQLSNVFAELHRVLKPAGVLLIGSIPDARVRDEFLAPYLAGVRAAAHLSEAQKAAIFARNEAASWYDPDRLARWWRGRAASAQIIPVADGDPDAGHRFHLRIALSGA